MFSLLVLVSSVPVSLGSDRQPAVPPSRSALHFVENQGQWSSDALFQVKGLSTETWVARDGFLVTHRQPQPSRSAPTGSTNAGHVVRVRIEGLSLAAPRGFEATESRFHYMIGEPSRWRNNVRSFRTVEVPATATQPGVRYSITDQQLRYDILVPAEASTSPVSLRYEGARNLRLDATGALQYDTSLGTHREAGRFVYQWLAGRKVPVPYQIQVKGNRVSYQVQPVDTRQPVVIDPQVVTYASYLGSTSRDQPQDVIALPNGNVVVASRTSGTDMPVTPGAFQEENSSVAAALQQFRGNQLIAGTYFGSRIAPIARVQLIAGDNITMAVQTLSSATDLPWEPSSNSGSPRGPVWIDRAGAIGPTDSGMDTVYIAKFKADLSQIRFATFYGGSENTELGAIAADSAGNIVVAGSTDDPFLPVTVNRGDLIRRGTPDGYVARFSTELTRLETARFITGTDSDEVTSIAIRPNRVIVIGGSTMSADFFSANEFKGDSVQSSYAGRRDGYAMILNGRLQVQAVTYLGGRSDDRVNAVALTADQLLVGGMTHELPFRTRGFDQRTELEEGFVARMSLDLTQVHHFTYVGGQRQDSVLDLAVFPNGQIGVLSSSFSSAIRFDGSGAQLDVPVTTESFDYLGATGYLHVLNPQLRLVHGTRLSEKTDLTPVALTMTGLYNDLVVASTGVEGLPTSDRPNLPAYQPTAPGGGDVFLQRVAYSADPTDLRLSATTLPSGRATIFGNVLTNAARTFDKSFSVRSSDARLAPVSTTTVVPAGTRQSNQIQWRRRGTFTERTDVQLTISEGSRVVLTATVTVEP